MTRLASLLPQLLRPPIYREAHEQRAAALANAILWISVVGPLVYGLFTLRLPVPLVQRAPLLAAIGVPLVGLTLLRRGALRATSVLLVLAFLAIALWGAARSGGLRSPSATLLFIPVLLSGQLLGARAALATGLVAVLEIVLLTVAGSHGLLPAPVVQHTDQTYALALGIELGAAGGFAALAARLMHATVSDLRGEARAARAADEALSESLGASPDALFTVDENGIITRSNRAHERLLDRRRADIVGQHFLAVHRLAAGEAARARSHFATILSGRASRLCLSHRRRDGSQAVIEVHPRLHVHASGARTVEVTIRDVSARVAAEQRVRELEQALEEARREASVGRLASGVAHDFNNVLAVILSHTADAGRERMLSIGERQRLELIADAAERGARLSRQLLGVARRHPNAPGALAAGDALAEMRPFLRSLLGPRDELLLAIDANPRVGLQPGQLDQIIVNLLVNARDAMPAGGRIEVRIGAHALTANAPRPPLPAADYAVITVNDTGEGMAPEVLAHVFEPFFTTKTQGKGTGIGLATVSAIAQKAGGHVFVTSTERAGTSFEVYLPVVAPGPLPVPPPLEPEPPLAPALVAAETALSVV